MATGVVSVGVPIKLLHEGEGHVVTVELKNGETYRGMLTEAEDSMNCQMKEVTMTARDGRVSRLENVYLRGGNIKFIVLPELLKSAPIFKKVQIMRTKKVGDMDLNGGRGGRGGDAGRGRGRGREGGRGAGRGRN